MNLANNRCALALGAVFLAGCSAAKGSLSGEVTYQGMPVVYGTVTAVGGDGITHSANIEPDGTYRLNNLPAGEVKLAVISPEPPDAAAIERHGERSGGKIANPGGLVRAKWLKIPGEYGDPRTSQLTTTVTANHSIFHLQLR
jgi:hypothetical protein